VTGVTLTFHGLQELKADLRQLPAALTGEAIHLVQAEGNAAAFAIRGAYPEVTGHLRQGVGVEPIQRTQFFAGVRVVSRAPHAHLYEYGTQVRHTALGANRGASPPHPVFVPRMIQARARMYAGLADLLVRHGLRAIG